jgi:hypothetical protein
MSSSQQFSAFDRSRQIIEPRKADALASYQNMVADAEACPITAYTNPVSYADLFIPEPICAPNPGAVGNIFEANDTLQGGSQNPNGLQQYGVMRYEYTSQTPQPNYLH